MIWRRLSNHISRLARRSRRALPLSLTPLQLRPGQPARSKCLKPSRSSCPSKNPLAILAWPYIPDRMKSFIPVDRLPDEVLSAIFVLGIRQLIPAAPPPEVRTSLLLIKTPAKQRFLRAISHVSRRWRTVALDTASLWTSIDVSYGTSLDQAKAFAARSKNLPLDVRCDFKSMSNPLVAAEKLHREQALKILRMCAPRFSSLSFLGVVHGTDQFLSILQAGGKLPHWRTLYFTDEIPHLTDWTDAAHLDGAQRRVENVEFDGPHFFWNSPIYIDLVSLNLHNCNEQISPSSSDFDKIL